jgi:hypothetical protein
MLEEIPNFAMSVIIAAVLVAAAAVMLMYFNPQRVADYGAAAVYPLVRPLNGSHVWLGAEPAFGPVEVEYVAYNGTRIPVGAQLDGPAWLNYSGGPVAVPCGANVTMVTRHGLAARAESFAVICLQRRPVEGVSAQQILRRLLSYADYVLDYVAYRSVPVLSAYFSTGSLHVGLQDVAPFPFSLVLGNISASGPAANASLWMPAAFTGIVDLAPGEGKDVYDLPYGVDKHTMYRWINLVAYANGLTLEVWINNVLIYNGTNKPFNVTAPQGFNAVYDGKALSITYKTVETQKQCTAYDQYGNCVSYNYYDVVVWRTASLGGSNSVPIKSKGVTQWTGWAKFDEMMFWPTESWSLNEMIYVMPAGPYLGEGGLGGGLNGTLLGVIPPFSIYSVTAVRGGNGTGVYFGTANLANLTGPGVYYVQLPVRGPQTVYYDGKVAVVFAAYGGRLVFQYATVGGAQCGFTTIDTKWGNSWSKQMPIPWGWKQIAFCPHETITVHPIAVNNAGYIEIYANGTLVRRAGPYPTAPSGPPDLTYSALIRNEYSYWYPGNAVVAVYVGNGSVSIAAGDWRAINWYTYSCGSGCVTEGYNIYPAVIDVGGNISSIPVAWRLNVTGAYVYRLVAKVDVSYTDLYGYVYRVNYAGWLKLYLNNTLVSYDAMYGTLDVLISPPSGSHSVGTPGGVCVPVETKTPLGLGHKDLQKYGGSYQVDAYKKYLVTIQGCGQDTSYVDTEYVTTRQVSSTVYNVFDHLNNATCNYYQAQNGPDNWVVCGTTN